MRAIPVPVEYGTEFFSPAGQFLLSAGGEGEGPGEFRRLEFVGVTRGDSLITYDKRLRRIQIFDGQGVFARTLHVESLVSTAAPDKMIGMVDSVTAAIRFIDFGDEVPSGIHRWPDERVVTMDLKDGQIAPVRVVPGSEASVEALQGGGYSHGRYLFGKGPVFAAGLGRIAWVDSEALAVTIMDPAGVPTLLLRKPTDVQPANREALESYADALVDILHPEGTLPLPEAVQRRRQQLFSRPRSSTLPVVRSVQVDAGGNIWVEPYFILGSDPPPFVVFGADGTWLGTVSAPPGLDRGFIAYQAPYLEIGHDYFLGIWKDDLNVPYVRMYPLTKDQPG